MSSDKPKTRAMMIMEVLGRPPEHLTETLKKFEKKISEEKGVAVINAKYHDAVELKDQKDLFTSYMEIEVEVDDVLYLTMLIFKYMPAHIEVISPEVIGLTNNGWNDVLNEITRRLHGYDEVARILQNEKQILTKQLEATKNKR